MEAPRRISAELRPLDAHQGQKDQSVQTPRNSSVSTWLQPPTISDTATHGTDENVQIIETPSVSNNSTNSNSSNSQSSGSNGSTHTVQVSVNGETVETNDNGSTHKTITGSDGSTKIDVNVQSTAQSGTSSNTTVNTQSFSDGTTTINGQTFKSTGND